LHLEGELELQPPRIPKAFEWPPEKNRLLEMEKANIRVRASSAVAARQPRHSLLAVVIMQVD